MLCGVLLFVCSRTSCVVLQQRFREDLKKEERSKIWSVPHKNENICLIAMVTLASSSLFQ